MDEPTSCGGPSMNRASSSTSSCIAAVTKGGGDNFLATVAKGDALKGMRYAPRVSITDELKSYGGDPF
jgi:hypothetical protein